jgi:hypothetical protein
VGHRTGLNTVVKRKILSKMNNIYNNVIGKAKGRCLLKDLGIDGKIILASTLKETRCEGVDCIHLAQDRVL